MTASEFQPWIGRTRVADDIVTPRLVQSFRATLHPYLASSDDCPLGLHWCLAPDIADADKLGPDGHPAKGDFLPPISLPRRMWAGGKLSFLGELRVGDRVERRSRIAAVEEKTGRAGRLCFVTLSHEYITRRGLAIEETQSIVYRDANAGPSAAVPPSEAMVAERSESIAITPPLLFRYSALTFNGHRIHYDVPYAVQAEGYSGLVVHGPLQATLLLNFAARVAGSTPRSFSFQGIAPAARIETLTMHAHQFPDGSTSLWMADKSGRATMTSEMSQ